MAIEVPLGPSLSTIVDDEDQAVVAACVWRVHRGRNTQYAYTGISGRKVYLHRLLMGEPIGFHVDHIDGDGLNNRRANLRLATNAQNIAAQVMISANGFRGVYRVRNKWRAEVGSGKTRYTGPVRATAEEAAADYDRAALEKYGDFARLNFAAEAR